MGPFQKSYEILPDPIRSRCFFDLPCSIFQVRNAIKRCRHVEVIRTQDLHRLLGSENVSPDFFSSSKGIDSPQMIRDDRFMYLYKE